MAYGRHCEERSNPLVNEIATFRFTSFAMTIVCQGVQCDEMTKQSHFSVF